MSDPKDKPAPGPKPKRGEARKSRLATALRANLRRRKAAVRTPDSPKG